MEIKVRYFGQLAEFTGKSEEIITQDFKTLEGLKLFLFGRYPKLKEVHFKMAQDNSIESESSELKGTLIDLLPPFSGG